MRIGVPRALHTYNHFRQWQTFFNELGCEVVLSSSTTRTVVEDGIRLAPSELCLPAKVFLGHINSLKKNVDALFIPRLVCRLLARDCYFGCPKTIALPDLVRAVFPDIPQIIELLVDEREKTELAAFIDVAKQIKQNNYRAKKAFCKAQLTCEIENSSAITHMFQVNSFGITSVNEQELDSDNFIKIGVIGHSYLIFDECVSLKLLRLIKEFNAQPLVPFVSKNELLRVALDKKSPNWYYELELIAGAKRLIEIEKVKGILFIANFACGTAPVVNEIIRREIVKGTNIPFLTLTIDEHTAEAGLRIRVESFIDLIRR